MAEAATRKERAEAGRSRRRRRRRHAPSRATIVMSICPPHAALDVARRGQRLQGLYVDCERHLASSCQRGRLDRGERAEEATSTAAIIGAPPPADSTRVHLSGERAARSRAVSPGDVVTHILGRRGVRLRRLGAEDVLRRLDQGHFRDDARHPRNGPSKRRRGRARRAQWSESQPGALRRRAASGTPGRGPWLAVDRRDGRDRSSFIDVGLPGGFHEAAGEIYSRVPRKVGATISDATMNEVVDVLLGHTDVKNG
jgi:hypothetical protein